jgi:hypothetical protein
MKIYIYIYFVIHIVIHIYVNIYRCINVLNQCDVSTLSDVDTHIRYALQIQHSKITEQLSYSNMYKYIQRTLLCQSHQKDYEKT